MYQITAENFVISSYCRDRRFVLNDIARTKRHIKAGDYFGTLATILDLIDKKVGRATSNQSGRMGELKNDLMFLQENYKIVKKIKR